MELKELIGKTLKTVAGKVGDSVIVFEATGGEKYKFYHQQECCETVIVDDIYYYCLRR